MEKLLYKNFSLEYIQNKMAEFRAVISRLEDIYNKKPFNQQTAQSLTELFLLVHAINPQTIIEIGCGTRSSTIALATAVLPEASIFGVDISPVNFSNLMSSFPNVAYKAPEDMKINACDFNINPEWNKPVFMLYDAHDDDLPGYKISEQALRNWFPKMSGQIVAFHDCTVSTNASVDSSHFSALHFSGRYVKGYEEVVPLVKWMNTHKIEFNRPGDELSQMGLNGEDSSLIYIQVP